MNADAIIAKLGLKPHPEGGWYRQTWQATEIDGNGRAVGTCIYFLLKSGERSHWHCVDATEIWHHYLGAPIILSVAPDAAGPKVDHKLGQDLAAGQRPQVIVPGHAWQSARSLGAFSLVGCTVSPGFRFEGFALADPDFDIPGPSDT